MRYTKAQACILNLASESVDGFALEQVKILPKSDERDLVAVLRDIGKGRTDVPGAHVRCCAASGWDVVSTMCQVAKVKTGTGYVRMISDSLLALSKDRAQPVTLWLEEMRHMRLVEREKLIFRLENVAYHRDVNLRIVMFNGQVKVYVGRDLRTGDWIGSRLPTYLSSEKLNQFARQWEYDGRRVNASEETPLFAANDHAKVVQLAVAV